MDSAEKERIQKELRHAETMKQMVAPPDHTRDVLFYANAASRFPALPSAMQKMAEAAALQKQHEAQEMQKRMNAENAMESQYRQMREQMMMRGIGIHTIAFDEAVGQKQKNPEKIKTPVPRKIVDHLNEYVIGQDRAKKALACAAYFHYFRTESSKAHFAKSNVCIVGPTGTGKTFLLSTLAEFLGVPFTVIDATELTPDGYVGRDVGGFIEALIEEFGEEKAAKAIIFIDEADKLSAGGRSGGSGFKTQEIQRALLKLVEGKVAGSAESARRGGKVLDTSKMLFVIGGAFSSITSREDYKGRVKSEDLVRHGLMPEFVGRFPLITTLDPLSVDDMVSIMTTAKNNVIDEYKTIFKEHDCELSFDAATVKLIATRAFTQHTGARGIRGVIEGLMLEHMFELPDRKHKRIDITLDEAA